MEELIDIIVPVSICVVLPIMIVWLTSRARINRDNKNAEILQKVIETNPNLDPSSLISAFSKPKKTLAEIQRRNLLFGIAFAIASIPFGITAWLMSDDTSVNVYMTPLIICGISLAIGIAFLTVYFVTKSKKD